MQSLLEPPPPSEEPRRCEEIHTESGQRCAERLLTHKMSGEYAIHASKNVTWITVGFSQPACYPCAKCGKLRTEAQGGKTFTVCDDCWSVPSPEPPREEPR